MVAIRSIRTVALVAGAAVAGAVTIAVIRDRASRGDTTDAARGAEAVQPQPPVDPPTQAGDGAGQLEPAPTVPTPVTTPPPTTPPATTPPATTPPAPTLLRVGASGPEVAALNARLSELGYAVDAGDSYGDSTYHAVMAFQKVNGLDRDGIAGPQTRGALDHPRTPDIGTGDAHRIVIDLSDQTLFLVDDGKLSSIVSTSTGNPNLADGKGISTRLGTFHVGRRYDGRYVGSLGALYWPAFFDGGIAVHGAPSVPGYPASHGCARVPMHLAKMLHDEMPAGTQVIVRP